MVNNNCH